MKLAALQEAFQAHVLRGDPQIAQHIAGDQRFATALRLGVYADAYALRLIEVLAESFPAVQQALGPKRFAQLAGEFARARPSRFRSARAYGEELPPWLAARLRGPRATGIADLGRFEWAVAAAFDAADRPVLEPSSLAAFSPGDWPRLQFEFTPSLQRLNLTSNGVAFWRFACAAGSRPSRWRVTCVQHWLIWRRELAIYYRRLSQLESQVLDAARAGHSFAELCEQMADATRAATVLHGWFSEGLVSAVSVRR